MQKVCEQLRFILFSGDKNGKIRSTKKTVRLLYKRFYKQGADAEPLPLKQGLKLF